ncbi:hypothetical protein PBY51_023077 [Eleginops maclovinus]|uniref:Uncharacterized protein n=1 Tax=Eleginops maclovinus TaxID=56733 RepID=A0AAN7X272_ELEMC|nr:hypothetical protein PBY51_023077 [Eleginops maclovinus]
MYIIHSVCDIHRNKAPVVRLRSPVTRSGFYEPLPAAVGGSWTTKQAVPLCRKTQNNTPKKGALQLETCAILELGREQPNRNREDTRIGWQKLQWRHRADALYLAGD